jgi:hypothetical protein
LHGREYATRLQWLAGDIPSEAVRLGIQLELEPSLVEAIPHPDERGGRYALSFHIELFGSLAAFL